MGFPLFLESDGAALDEPRPAPLGKADIDDIEVPGNDCLAEHGARLPQDLRPEVAVGEVGQDEHSHLACEGELGGRRSGRVERLVSPLALLRREGGFVHEHVRRA